MDPEDPLPKMIADLDQLAAMAPQLARMARVWFDAFEAEGFNAAQALYLSACTIVQDTGKAP